MNTDPQTRITEPWRTLQDGLGNSFAARTRNFLGNEFVLSGHSGEDQGRLKLMGLRGAKLTAGGLEAVVSHAAGSGYTMLSGGEGAQVLLRAGPAGAVADKLEIRCGERAYTATVSLFRNRAVAYDEAGVEAVRLAGNVTGRAYKVETSIEDPCALPVAMLLIYHTALHRRRAYRVATGS